MAYKRSTRSRWMILRYAGTCKVCGKSIPAGGEGFWDATSKTVTCHSLACCEADGLTQQVWSGSPVSGRFVASRTAQRVGRAAPRIIETVFNSGAVAHVNANGRCEDAPCCGCCD